MAEDEQKKPGFFGRLFGRGARTADEATPQEPSQEPPQSADEAAPAAFDPLRVDLRAEALRRTPATPEPASPEPAESRPAPPVESPPTAAPDQQAAESPGAPAADGSDAPAADSSGAPAAPFEPAASALSASEPDAGEPPEAAPEAPVLPERAPATPPSVDPPPDDPLPVETPSVEALPAAADAKKGWWSRLKAGLSRSSSAIGQGISDIFTRRKLDAAALEDLEDILIRADLGAPAALRIVEAVGRGRYDKQVAPEEIKQILAEEIARSLAPVARPFEIDATKKPFVVLVVGVNGSGKTTTIAKLAQKLTGEGRKVVLAAGDTFRAAAIEQLRVWGERLGAPVISGAQGADAAGLAYDAIAAAQAQGADVVLMDTAGRLQNRTELMAELEKIIRVMKKLDPGAPHATLLVLDATVGQNALSQVEIFGRTAGVTGLVMTKLDGTARGGILVAIAEKFKLPTHFIGVGESADDLAPFEPEDFAAAIAGLERKS